MPEPPHRRRAHTRTRDLERYAGLFAERTLVMRSSAMRDLMAVTARPEVSIVDIGLPGLTGFELARHARAAGYSGRMIALSGYGAERDARAALVAGFDAYLVKPVDRNELLASLNGD